MALTCGGPRVRARPLTVRRCSEVLKSSIARSSLSWAFVGTARTWRGSRGTRFGASALARLPGRSSASGQICGSSAAGVGASGSRPSRLRSGDAAEPEPLLAPARAAAAPGSPGGRLADPALLLGPRSAQRADELALAGRRQIRLGPLALQHRATAHVARLIGSSTAVTCAHGTFRPWPRLFLRARRRDHLLREVRGTSS